MSGWIAISREILDHPLFKKRPDRLYAWVWLLTNAAWKDARFDVGGEIITVQRGEICASQATMSAETGMTRKVLRQFLETMKTEGMVATRTAQKGAKSRAILSICNYDKYQDAGPKEGQRRAKGGPIKEQGNKGTSSSNEEHMASEAVKIWNSFAGSAGWSEVQKITKPRFSAINARLNECGGLDGWKRALGRAAASRFLTGQTDRPFFASFDWLTKPANFTKLMEGNYDTRPDRNPPAGVSGRGAPHDSLMAGFAAFANSDGSRGESDCRGRPQPADAGDEAMDRGPGGHHSQPILRIIHTG